MNCGVEKLFSPLKRGKTRNYRCSFCQRVKKEIKKVVKLSDRKIRVDSEALLHRERCEYEGGS
ncbi:MAG: hypothetical protein J7L63_04245, partial [Thermoplasmata archaeon]|nr:hypothetical protein [Thermoplasmata archaeon]